MAALMFSGSPWDHSSLKGNKGVGGAGSLLDYVFSIPTVMTLVQNCITSLLDSCKGPLVSMASPLGQFALLPPVYSQTVLQKYLLKDLKWLPRIKDKFHSLDF